MWGMHMILCESWMGDVRGVSTEKKTVRVRPCLALMCALDHYLAKFTTSHHTYMYIGGFINVYIGGFINVFTSANMLSPFLHRTISQAHNHGCLLN